MAYTDSGLGWYANSNWMTDEAGTIGEIETGLAGEFRKLPYWAGRYPDISGADIIANALEVIDWTQSPVNGYRSFVWQFGGENVDAYFTAYKSGSTYACSIIAAEDYGTVFYYARLRADNSIESITGGASGVNLPSESYAGHTLYRRENAYGVSPPSQIVDITPYNSLNDARDAFLVGGETVTYSKSSAGYSVTCMCKWNEELYGDVYISPVLISTENSATFWTVNGNTPIQQLTEHEWHGVNFFMRLYKTHIFDDQETVTANFPLLDIVEEEAYSSPNDVFRFIALASELGVGPVPEDDPYSGGGESEAESGEGTFDFTSDDIPIPNLPSIGAYNTGFINMYKPTAGDLRDLAHYLWSGSFTPENLRKLIANPMDAILGLHIVPATASHPAGSAATLYVGNIDTQLSMLRLTEQYYELDCGTINIEPKWGAYLDYAPYSKLTLYLPYIGFVPISPDDCMGGSINVKYHVDVLSGACCVYVYCTSNRGEDSHVLYSYTGACACDCPVTEGQYTNAILGILNIAGSVAGAISGALTGNAGGVTGGIENAANAALSMVKPDISRSGSFGGSAGLMGIQYPYLVLTVPRMCTPGDQQKQEGYPSFVTKALGQLAGYNQVQVKRLDGMTCTANETEEILALLEGGVIF